MNRVFENLGIGQKVKGRVEALLSTQFLLINLEGSYLSVENKSSQRFQIGDEVELVVESTMPLRMKLHHAAQGPGLNLHI